MQSFLNAIDNEQNQLEKIIGKLNRSLKKKPPGKLYITMKDGKYAQYYHYLEEQKEKFPKGCYINKKDFRLVVQLCQKEYEEQILDTAQKQLKRLKKFRSHYDPLEINRIFENTKSIKKELITPLVYNSDWYAQKWSEQKFVQKNPPKEGEGVYTLKGEHVRSKSEQSIADTYNVEGIPYRYEAELILKDGVVIHPDFTILNVRTGKTYYHEHLGKMGDMKYAGEAIARINQYERNGIFPGDELIITAETLENQFDNRIMDAIIKQYLK